MAALLLTEVDLIALKMEKFPMNCRLAPYDVDHLHLLNYSSSLDLLE